MGLCIIVSLLAALPLRSAAAQERTPPTEVAALPWWPSWPGTEMAVVSGDPFGTGSFVFRFRMPDGYWICPHTHPIDAHILAISGSFLVGMGSEPDTSALRALAPGDEIALQAGMAHYEGTRGTTLIEIRGVGPWGIAFVDPRYDPSAVGALPCTPSVRSH